MHPFLDSPQTIDREELSQVATTWLANQEVRFRVDGNIDLHDLFWPWANHPYAASIKVRVVTLTGDELNTLTNRYFASHQEAILGNESIIVSKRLMAPFKSSEDRSVIWNLECQAEGDHVIRLEVEIDWGEALTQRMVDGLLLAQRNPQAARGIYEQSNAESTRVFGNPHARPDIAEIDDPQRARLIYHVLINGEVQVALLLTISDVGEQMAWSTFLGLRDSDETFDKSVRSWEETLRTGRLWTPDSSFNHAVQTGRVLALNNLHQLRTGYAPPDRSIEHAAQLVSTLDAFDPTASRNLLAHFRRTLEQNNGRLPTHFPLHPKAPIDDPGSALIQTNDTYLRTLTNHLRHHFDAELLARHSEAIQLCSEALIRNRWEVGRSMTLEELWQSEEALRRSLHLATLHNDHINSTRWQSEVVEFVRLANQERPPSFPATPPIWHDWSKHYGWREPSNQPWHFADLWQGINLAADAIWQGAGLDLSNAPITVAPTWPSDWLWWALLDFPATGGKLRIVWDGSILHSNLLVSSGLPTQFHERIRALGFDELDWNPRFEFVDNGEVSGKFYPTFT